VLGSAAGLWRDLNDHDRRCANDPGVDGAGLGGGEGSRLRVGRGRGPARRVVGSPTLNETGLEGPGRRPINIDDTAHDCPWQTRAGWGDFPFDLVLEGRRKACGPSSNCMRARLSPTTSGRGGKNGGFHLRRRGHVCFGHVAAVLFIRPQSPANCKVCATSGKSLFAMDFR